jgi:hypothetical protein
MATATFPVRFFLAMPEEFIGPVTGTYSVTGSISNLLINNTNTGSGDDIYEVGDNGGWFPGPPTIAYEAVPQEGYLSYGIIVGGRGPGYTSPGNFANTAADNRSGGSYVSCWGWITQATQGANETEFIALAQAVIGDGAIITNLATAKGALKDAGYYYQFPVGFDGQSPNTGAGSDA